MMNPSSMPVSLLGFMFPFKLAQEPVALVFRQPLNHRGTIREEENGSESRQNRGDSLQDEDPTPAGQSEPLNAKKLTGSQSRRNVCKRNRGNERCDGLGAIFQSEPDR